MMNNKLSVLVIGDPHFKVSNVYETEKMADEIIRIAKEKNPDIIVVLGDILDRHENIHSLVLTRATKFLAALMKISPTYVLIGNHDLKNNKQFMSDEHAFTTLKYLTNNDNNNRITIVDTTIAITIKTQLCVFVPYVPPGRFLEALNICPEWPKATVIFAHQEFKGAQMGAFVSVEGDEYDSKYPYVISGHIHDYQELQNNILYVGTPIQHTFGDQPNKTISYFTFIDQNQRLQERIDLKIIRKTIVHISCSEVEKYIPQENFQLKIVISGNDGEIKAIMKNPHINTWKQAGHKITYKTIPLMQTNASIANIAPLRFSMALLKRIENEPLVLQVYEDIFGKTCEVRNVQQKLSLNVL